MTLVRFNNRECSPYRRYNREAADLFNLFWSTPQSFNGHFDSPSANIVETDENYRIEMWVPGWDKSEFRIKVDSGILEISGNRSDETHSDSTRYTRREFRIHPFSRRFRLSDRVNSDQIKAMYENGILLVEIPKKEEAKAKPAIEIQVS